MISDKEKHELAQLEEAKAKIDSFASYKANWDSYGGRPITFPARKSALAILNAFYTWAHASIPLIFPTADGGVSLAWGDEDIYIDINELGESRVWTDGVPEEER